MKDELGKINNQKYVCITNMTRANLQKSKSYQKFYYYKNCLKVPIQNEINFLDENYNVGKSKQKHEKLLKENKITCYNKDSKVTYVTYQQ